MARTLRSRCAAAVDALQSLRGPRSGDEVHRIGVLHVTRRNVDMMGRDDITHGWRGRAVRVLAVSPSPSIVGPRPALPRGAADRLDGSASRLFAPQSCPLTPQPWQQVRRAGASASQAMVFFRDAVSVSPFDRPVLDTRASIPVRSSWNLCATSAPWIDDFVRGNARTVACQLSRGDRSPWRSPLTRPSLPLLASFAGAKRHERPTGTGCCRRACRRPRSTRSSACRFPRRALGGVSGKREVHNATRRYFDVENRAKFPVVAAISEAMQDTRVTKAVESTFGTRLDGTYLRIEYAQDTNGFWLEPHSDLGVKLFTYCSTSRANPRTPIWAPTSTTPTSGKSAARRSCPTAPWCSCRRTSRCTASSRVASRASGSR